jgi:pyrroline-5-carboxylate reductase
MPEHNFGFIGAGRMATALARGFIAAGLAAPERILASDPVPAALDQFRATTGGSAAGDNVDVIAAADTVFLAVKPQQMNAVLAELKGRLTGRHLIISIAAGVPLATLAVGVGPGPRLVRVMPNTPCLIGRGASAYCLGQGATDSDRTLVRQLLEAVGLAVEVDEKLMDAVTGLSGSGPAFVYVAIEALSDAGVRVGLPRDGATKLAAQTVLGAAQMVLQTGEHPGVLKDAVASPGGTTIAGLAALEAGGARAALMAAVIAATERSQQLGAQAPSLKA